MLEKRNGQELVPRLILRKRKGSPLLVIKGKNGERKKASHSFILLKEENPGLWSPNKSSSFSLEHKGFLCLLLAPRERRVVKKEMAESSVMFFLEKLSNLVA